MPKATTQIVFPLSRRFAEDSRSTRNVIAWSGLMFAVLQSICTFFAALNGLPVGIGFSSLAMAAGTAATIDRFHVDWLRVPMISLALLGSVLNLVVLWQIRRLRQHPAARWRQVPPDQTGCAWSVCNWSCPLSRSFCWVWRTGSI